MSRIIYFTTNGANGFQLSTDVMETLQRELQDLIKAFICVTGDNVILCGVTGPSGGSLYSDGLIVWNNEFLYFEGGVFGQYLVIKEETVQLTFCDDEVYDAYTIRTAIFKNTLLPEDDEFIDVLNQPGLGVFTYIDTISNIITNVTNNTNNITSNYNDLQNQITNLTNIVNQNSVLDNFEIGDIKYIKNITNFGPTGLGLVGTNREKWALVTDQNVEWKNAIGYTGSFATFQGRTLVIAGTTYSVLNEFGNNSYTMVANNIPEHNHTFSGTTSSNGGHTHQALEVANATGTQDKSIDWRTHSNIQSTGAQDNQTIQPVGDHFHTYSGTTSSFGSVSPLPIDLRQPSIAMYMAIKYQA